MIDKTEPSTSATPTFVSQKEFNKDLEVSATPKEFPSEIPSLNPDIIGNFKNPREQLNKQGVTR
ncbi:MAG: hypothetical protein ACOC5T_02230 [Elusimicrobiota bacterium]